MSLPVAFRRAARSEYDEAGNWYAARRRRLGVAFAAAVQGVLDRAAGQPSFYAAVLDDVREAPVPGFPYCVYYREEPGQVVVLAVFHTSRDSSVWQSRV